MVYYLCMQYIYYIYIYITYIYVHFNIYIVLSKLSKKHDISGHKWSTTHREIRSSSFCEIWALFVSWITYDHLYYAPCLACWALFGSLVPTMCNCPSCAQVHELPQNHCGDNPEGTLFSWLHIYIYIYISFSSI